MCIVEKENIIYKLLHLWIIGRSVGGANRRELPTCLSLSHPICTRCLAGEGSAVCTHLFSRGHHLRHPINYLSLVHVARTQHQQQRPPIRTHLEIRLEALLQATHRSQSGFDVVGLLISLQLGCGRGKLAFYAVVVLN